MGAPFEIVKVDAPQRVVYGWGNICVDENGIVTDCQGDQIPPEELEKAVVDFMENCRDSGVMHEGKAVGTVVASLVTTPDIVKAFFGDQTGFIPTGWIIGVKVASDEILKDVVGGRFRAFSIQGHGERNPVNA